MGGARALQPRERRYRALGPAPPRDLRDHDLVVGLEDVVRVGPARHPKSMTSIPLEQRGSACGTATTGGGRRRPAEMVAPAFPSGFRDRLMMVSSDVRLRRGLERRRPHGFHRWCSCRDCVQDLDVSRRLRGGAQPECGERRPAWSRAGADDPCCRCHAPAVREAAERRTAMAHARPEYAIVMALLGVLLAIGNPSLRRGQLIVGRAVPGPGGRGGGMGDSDHQARKRVTG